MRDNSLCITGWWKGSVMSKVVWETVISDSTFVPRHLSMPEDCGDGLSDVGGCLLSILSRLPPSQSQVLKKTAPSPPHPPGKSTTHFLQTTSQPGKPRPIPTDQRPAELSHHRHTSGHRARGSSLDRASKSLLGIGFWLLLGTIPVCTH